MAVSTGTAMATRLFCGYASNGTAWATGCTEGEQENGEGLQDCVRVREGAGQMRVWVCGGCLLKTLCSMIPG